MCCANIHVSPHMHGWIYNSGTKKYFKIEVHPFLKILIFFETIETTCIRSRTHGEFSYSWILIVKLFLSPDFYWSKGIKQLFNEHRNNTKGVIAYYCIVHRLCTKIIGIVNDVRVFILIYTLIQNTEFRQFSLIIPKNVFRIIAMTMEISVANRKFEIRDKIQDLWITGAERKSKPPFAKYYKNRYRKGR